MYKRFIRWASDRLEDDGIIGFVSNSAFLDARQDDGFRKVVAEEFNELWAIDLKGNARTSGERRRQQGGNVFDDKIRVGVAIYFLVRRKSVDGFKVYYNGSTTTRKPSTRSPTLRARLLTLWSSLRLLLMPRPTGWTSRKVVLTLWFRWRTGKRNWRSQPLMSRRFSVSIRLGSQPIAMNGPTILTSTC